MIRSRLAAALASLALAACARTTGSEAVVVVDIPAAVPVPAELGARPPRHPLSAPDFVGHWEGVGRQKNGSSWKMIVDIESVGPGRCARVRYPTVPCAAEWICAGGVKDGALHAREHLTEDVGNCIDDGDMKMSLSPDGRLDWRWEASSSDETAEARLTRR
jgi:hypothetical protein